MRVVKLPDVLIAYVLIFVFAGSLVAGVFRWRFFILAASALVLYLVWTFWRLRCPWCRSGVELGRLLLGPRRTCHCPACGHEITVVLRVNKNIRVPSRRPDTPPAPSEDLSEDLPQDLPPDPPAPRPRPAFFDAEKEEDIPQRPIDAPESEPENEPDSEPETEPENDPDKIPETITEGSYQS